MPLIKKKIPKIALWFETLESNKRDSTLKEH